MRQNTPSGNGSYFVCILNFVYTRLYIELHWSSIISTRINYIQIKSIKIYCIQIIFIYCYLRYILLLLLETHKSHSSKFFFLYIHLSRERLLLLPVATAPSFPAAPFASAARDAATSAAIAEADCWGCCVWCCLGVGWCGVDC